MSGHSLLRTNVVRLIAAFLFFLALSVISGQPVARKSLAAVTNSYSSFGNQSFTAPASASCGAEFVGNPIATGMVVKRILPVGSGNFYISGCFLDWSGIPDADYLAYWNETSHTWSAVGTPAFNNIVNDMVIYNGDLYVGGEFTDAAGLTSADYVARWNGISWSALPNQFSSSPLDATSIVTELAVRSSDSTLVIVGKFPAGIAKGDATYIANTIDIAAWNGSTWSAVTASTPYNGDSGVSSSTEASSYYPRTVAFIGSDIYIGGYRAAGYTNIARSKMFLRYNSSSTTWTSLGTAFTPLLSSEATQGYGVMTLAVSGTSVLLGGTLHNVNGDHLLSYSPSGNSYSPVNSQYLGYIQQGAGVRRIITWGSHIFVVGAFSGGVNASASFLHWNGSEWQDLHNFSSNISNDIALDENWSGSSDRLLLSTFYDNIGDVPAADQFAGVALTNTATLDSLNSTNASPALSFTGSNSYNITIPNSATGETLSFAASASAASVLVSTDNGPFWPVVSSSNISINAGSSGTISIKVISTDGSATQTYVVTIAREVATTTVASTSPPSSTTPASTTPTTQPSPTTLVPAQNTSPLTTSPTTSVQASPTTTSTLPTSLVKSGTQKIANILAMKKINVPLGAKVTFKVVASSAKVCKATGSSVKGVKTGTCKLSVTIKPKSGKTVVKNISILVK